MGNVRAQNTTDSTQDLNAVLASSSIHKGNGNTINNGNGNGNGNGNSNYHHSNASVSVTGSQRSRATSTNSEITFQTSNMSSVNKRPSVIKTISGKKFEPAHLDDGGESSSVHDTA